MSTKKDFIAAAKMVANMANRNEAKKTAENFADMFSRVNLRFNKELFFKACNIVIN
jgi:hypothetical protein